MKSFRTILRWTVLWTAALYPDFSSGEPRILIGPTDPDDAPEAVDAISGLSYDQLKRLRDLRKWLEERQILREQIELRKPENRWLRHHGEVFGDRQLLSPPGQRYADRLRGPVHHGEAALKFRPCRPLAIN